MNVVGGMSLGVDVVVVVCGVSVEGVSGVVKSVRCVPGGVSVEKLGEEGEVRCVTVTGVTGGGIVIVVLQVAWVCEVASGLTCRCLG